MSKCGQIRVADDGTELTVTFYEYNEDTDIDEIVDISSATVKQIILQDPSGNSATYTADFYTDGTDGKLSYITDGTEFDEDKTWKIQGYISMPLWSGHSTIQKIKIGENL